MSFSVTSQIVFCTSKVNFQQFIFDINKAYTTPFLPIAKNVTNPIFPFQNAMPRLKVLHSFILDRMLLVQSI